MDPVLAAHQALAPGAQAAATPTVFEMAGLRTASMADTMVRACALVRRLHAAQVLGPGRPLLVVGGGVGGVSAAVTAAELGAPVVLCMADEAHFHLQASCLRSFHPTEYHWPHPSWAAGRFPTQGEVPFPWVAGTGFDLALRWGVALDDWRATSPAAARLRFAPGLRLQPEDLKPQPGGGVLCRRADPHGTGLFAAAVSFAGTVHDGAVHGSFQGFRYWEADPFDSPHLGLPGASRRVLVSGAGDGALQDFIRVLTGRSAAQCMVALRLRLPREALALLSTEEEARRAHAWAARTPAGLHGVQQPWQAAFERAVQAQWFRWSAAHRRRLAARLLRPGLEVSLLHRCGHFGHVFALNRYLALLLARLHALQRGVKLPEVLLAGLALHEVKGPPGHTCGSPQACHAVPHDVWVQRQACSGTPGKPYLLGSFDAVVVRHGPPPQRLLGTPLLEEQLVPRQPV